MGRTTWTISLEPAFAKKAEDARRREHRTRSEFVREAIRRYLAAPTYTPTLAERRAIIEGRAEIRRGDYYTLDEFRDFLLADPGAKGRPKTRRPQRSSRSRAAR